jgi:phage protein U
MGKTMMQLGGYQFSIDNAAYQELTRSSEYRWAAQTRVGTTDALQFIGTAGDTIELRGTIYPYYKGGIGQIDSMRTQASIGWPLPLVSGQGKVLGLWVVEAIREGQAVFDQSGIPRRQEFEIRLRRYDGGLRAILPF